MRQSNQPRDTWVGPGEHMQKSETSRGLLASLADLAKPRVCVCDLSTGESHATVALHAEAVHTLTPLPHQISWCLSSRRTSTVTKCESLIFSWGSRLKESDFCSRSHKTADQVSWLLVYTFSFHLQVSSFCQCPCSLSNQNYLSVFRKFAPRCSVCKEPIMPAPGQEETVRIVALDRDFHVHCYRCEVCGQCPLTLPGPLEPDFHKYSNY